MKIVYQDKYDNCLQACVASLLELSLNDVPHFMENCKIGDIWTDAQWRNFKDFFESNEYHVGWLDPDLEEDIVKIRLIENSGIPYIATGYGKYGSHNVIMQGKQLLHDPAKHWGSEGVNNIFLVIFVIKSEVG